MAAASDSEDDEPCVAYMFDAAAATERRELVIGTLQIAYFCLADDDAAATHHISGHSAWPAPPRHADQLDALARHLQALAIEVAGGAPVAPSATAFLAAKAEAEALLCA